MTIDNLEKQQVVVLPSAGVQVVCSYCRILLSCLEKIKQDIYCDRCPENGACLIKKNYDPEADVPESNGACLSCHRQHSGTVRVFVEVPYQSSLPEKVTPVSHQSFGIDMEWIAERRNSHEFCELRREVNTQIESRRP